MGAKLLYVELFLPVAKRFASNTWLHASVSRMSTEQVMDVEKCVRCLFVTGRVSPHCVLPC